MLARLLRSVVRRHTDMRRNQFDVLPLPDGRVLFLGDSITEAGNWNEWFPSYRILNRGIGGDTVEGVRGRLGTAVNRPAAISLLVGTNDLHRQARVAGIAAQFAELVYQIRTLAPDSPLIVNSVMPRGRRWASRIHELNQRYAATARDADAGYVDLWPALADGDALRAAYTRDGIHLNGHGYQAWVDVLRPRLEAVLGAESC
jgi:lysophospholipase L1-like esterase